MAEGHDTPLVWNGVLAASARLTTTREEAHMHAFAQSQVEAEGRPSGLEGARDDDPDRPGERNVPGHHPVRDGDDIRNG
jgi:hypothetical protein